MKQGRNTAGTLTITGGDTARTSRYVSQAEKAAVRAEQSAAAAEAWAVGEKGGAPVGSTDETFHNNARHFAEQAAASVTGSAAQIQSNKQDVHDLKSAVKKKAPVIIDTASGAIVSFEDGADGMPIKALTVNIEPAQSGSGDPSPTNVRPISGWTGCNVTRTGKNLLDINAVTSGAVDHNTGEVVPNTSNKVTPLIKCEPSTTYVVSGFERAIRPKYYKSTIEYIGEAASTTLSTFTTPADCHFMRIQGINIAWSGAVNPQLELGSTATDYEPYQSETYHITFPAEAGTVYGGTLDVTAGVLTVDRANIASYSGETLPGKWISDRDVYAAGTIPTTGAQVVCELATPIEITLTPTQIDTLLGTNNIWADCGPVSVDYPADTKLYIQKINAPTDDDMIADTQIDSGKYFLINNSLYLSTTVIPAGDTIIPGTNCTKTNLAAALNALNT